MGRDKAALLVDGVPMAVRVAAALRDAGAGDVVLIGRGVAGGDPVVADEHPGEGPLGGVLTALRWAGDRLVVVAPCDLLAPDPVALRRLVDALAGPSASRPVAAVAGTDDPLPLALRPDAAIALEAAFAAGERGLRRALRDLRPVDAELPDRAVAGANTPADLPPGSG
jgi:molybdopterin-guanine dinucleotide biosynthesis protein A